MQRLYYVVIIIVVFISQQLLQLPQWLQLLQWQLPHGQIGHLGISAPLPVALANNRGPDPALEFRLHLVLLGPNYTHDYVTSKHVLLLGVAGDSGPHVCHHAEKIGQVREREHVWVDIDVWETPPRQSSVVPSLVPTTVEWECGQNGPPVRVSAEDFSTDLVDA